MTPIVMVHGFLGGSRQWGRQLDALGESELITLDLPGFGENASMDALESIQDYAQWVLGELDKNGVGNFHLLGHSMGGMVAQEIVSMAPDRIDQLVLYGTGPTGLLPGRFESIETSIQRANADGAQATARRIAATWFLKETKAEAYSECAEIAEQTNLHAILAGLKSMQDWSGLERLNDIRTKTLVIWGDQDRTYPWSQTERLWTSISGANLAVVPNSAHATHLEKPTIFNHLVRDFFSS